jgi:hypothetical protein
MPLFSSPQFYDPEDLIHQHNLCLWVSSILGMHYFIPYTFPLHGHKDLSKCSHPETFGDLSVIEFGTVVFLLLAFGNSNS